MGILLINVCGFLACSAVAVFGIKSVYHESQKMPHPDDYPEYIPLEERNITADVVGLSVEIVGYVLDCVGDVAEILFNSRPSEWFHELCAPLQFKPDGEYFKDTNVDSDFWDGYADDTPKFKPGKFEMEL